MMKRLYPVILGFALCLCPASVLGAAPPGAPDFQEVYELLQNHLAGVSPEELNHAAVQGLLKQFYPQVTLVDPGSRSDLGTNTAPALTTFMYEGAYGMLRLNQIGPDARQQFDHAFQALSASNRLKGLILDLRFAGGDNYAAATAVADQFFAREAPLIDWGQGLQKSTAKTNAINLPLAILVNEKTSAAAEALAAMLRFHELGLLLGAKTAGQASVAKEFKLQNGQVLRIATAPITVAGEKMVPLAGITPDIPVPVSPQDELAWFTDAYKPLPRGDRLASAGLATTNDVALAGTNRVSRRRLNEAELVRMQRDGHLPDFETNLATREPAPALARPTVQDPVLLRALDLLKGLVVVHQFRSP